MRVTSKADVFYLTRADFWAVIAHYHELASTLHVMRQERPRPRESLDAKRGRLYQMVGADAAQTTKQVPDGIIALDSAWRWRWDMLLLVVLLTHAVTVPWFAAFSPGTTR